LVSNKKYKLILVAGARPNFMKIAPIVRALRMHRGQRPEVGGHNYIMGDVLPYFRLCKKEEGDI